VSGVGFEIHNGFLTRWERHRHLVDLLDWEGVMVATMILVMRALVLVGLLRVDVCMDEHRVTVGDHGMSKNLSLCLVIIWRSGLVTLVLVRAQVILGVGLLRWRQRVFL